MPDVYAANLCPDLNGNVYKKSDDIIITTYHSHMGKSFGGPLAWGEDMASDGFDQNAMNLVIPANGYSYTGDILMFTASGNTDAQAFLLTTDGMWSWGATGEVVGGSIKSSSPGFGSMTMPAGVTPTDVLDIKANSDVFFLVTNAGEVWVAGQNVISVSGNASETANTWHKVETSSGIALTGAIELTGSREAVYVRKADGTLWTWGTGIALGGGAAVTNMTFATQMDLTALGGVSLSQIGTYMDNSPNSSGLLALGSDGVVYGIGYNGDGQLINNTSGDGFVSDWEAVPNLPGTVLFLATSDNSEEYATAAIITTTATTNNLYAWGEANTGNIGFPNGLIADPTIPNGFNEGSDNPIYTLVGGHAMSFADKSNDGRICFVGHITSGSGGGLQTDPDNFQCFGKNAAGWPDNANLCFQTPPTGTVSGSVKDTVSNPIAGVTVEIQDADGNVVDDVNDIPLSTTTLANGTYSFADVITDDYFIVETDIAGYASVSDGDSSDDSDVKTNTDTNDNKIPLTVEEDENDLDNNFVDVQAGTVAGSVKDTAGNAISGVTVEIKDNAGVVVNDASGDPLTTTTDGSGNYSFSNVPAGDYDIVETDSANHVSVSDGDASADGDANANSDTNDNKIPVTITLGKADVDNNFVDVPAVGAVSGVIYADNNGDGDQDTGEPGFSGVQIAITDSIGNVQTVTTDVNGGYSATVPSGSTQLDVDESTLPGGSVQTEGSEITTLIVPANGSATDIDGYQPPPNQGTLSGIVYEDSNGNGTQDSGEAGIAGVDVSITDSSSNIQTVMTDSNGAYSISVPAGNTLVDIDQNDIDSDFSLSQGTDPTTVNVPARGTATDIDGYAPGTLPPAVISAKPIPTLSEWGKIILMLLISVIALKQQGQRRKKQLPLI